MCELFGMSARVPAALTLSLDAFARHGGDLAPHRDGWGVAVYEEGDVRRLRGVDAAAESAWVRFLRERGVSTDVAIAHVRKANEGRVALRNTHPFTRELDGRMHVFAHNGHLHGVHDALDLGGYWRPVGETDSEHAFCALLERLRPLWRDVALGGVPPLEARRAVIAEFAGELRDLGPANFLYADGDALFAHAHRRKWEDDGLVRPPGLHALCRTCAVDPSARVTGGGVSVEAGPQSVQLFASVPLTDEAWQPLPEGTVVAARAGELSSQAA
jgi:glutamine amidotransferase